MNKIKKIKVWYAGTLDPLASGLLIICTGKSTKIISSIQDQKKTYTGEITLGASTPSFDLETEINKTYNVSNSTNKNIKEITLEVCEAGIKDSVKMMEEAIANGATLEDFVTKKVNA